MIYLSGMNCTSLNNYIRITGPKKGFSIVDWRFHNKPNRAIGDCTCNLQRIYWDTWEEGEWLDIVVEEVRKNL